VNPLSILNLQFGKKYHLLEILNAIPQPQGSEHWQELHPFAPSPNTPLRMDGEAHQTKDSGNE
jgi:hypothetical protein